MLRSKTFCIKKDAVYDKPLTIAKEKGENCAGDIAISRGTIYLSCVPVAFLSSTIYTFILT